MKINYLTKEELENSLAIKDLSDEKNGVHAINLVMNDIKMQFYRIVNGGIMKLRIIIQKMV